MDTGSCLKKSSSGTDPEKTEVPSMPYADNARGIMSPELLKGVCAPIELPPSGFAKTLRLIHRIPKMIPVMALIVVWNVEYGWR